MPRTRTLAAPEQLVDLTFPMRGIDRSRSFSGQAPLTTPIGRNVRTFEPTTGRARGGSRPALARYINAIPGGSAALIQDLNTLVGVGYTDPGGAAQSTSSGRIVDLVAVVAGKAYVASAGGSSWVTAGGQGTALLNTTGVVRSTSLNQKLYYADGTNLTVYDPSTNIMADLVATTGTLPGSGANLPRLIETWRGRLVLSGITTDPQNWFLSKVSDPTNWDYGPTNGPLADQAVAGNNGPLAIVGDVVTGIIPFTDDVLIFLCDHQLWQLSGDPMDGGKLDMISDVIGGAFGRAWCKGPDGTIYFMSNRASIYAMEPGGPAPQRISQQIDELLQPTNTGTKTVRLAWDEDNGGIHVYITTTASAAAETHYFWEQAAGAWWQDTFADKNFNPLCCTVFDGNAAGDRVSLIGSWDGYVRYFSDSATVDDAAGDGKAVDSYVALGPLQTANMYEVLLKDLQVCLGESSGDVTFSVYVARTAEKAITDMDYDLALPAGSEASSYRRKTDGTWSAGREFTSPVRYSGWAIFVLLESSNGWQLEMIRARLGGLGKVRGRGR